MTPAAVLILLGLTIWIVVLLVSKLTGMSVRCLFGGCANKRMYLMVRHRRCVRCDRVTIGDCPP